MSVGAELKTARKKAGLTIEVISKRTKISVSKVVALEKNDFKNLPTGLYLFSAVRAYAREVHIDPEPIVERLRAESPDTDALDALQALDATGALDSKRLGDGRSKEERSHFLRNAAIAAGVVLIAAAGAGAGVYLNNIGRITHEAAPPSPAPAATVATVATALDVPPQAVVSTDEPAPTKTDKPKPRPAAVMPQEQETVAAVDTVSEEPADTPSSIEEVPPEAPDAATAP